MRLELLIIGLFLTINSSKAQKNYIDQPYLETIANVDTSVTPDEIYLTILISESDTRGKQSTEELAQKMANALISIGINLDTQLVLTDLSSKFKKYILRKDDIHKSKAYELRVFNATIAGQVIYELESIGISNVDVDRTEYSKVDELLQYLRRKAVIKAKEQARVMVEPLDQDVGNAILISDIKTGVVGSIVARGAGIRLKQSEKSDQFYSMPIEFEKIKVHREVRVIFKLN